MLILVSDTALDLEPLATASDLLVVERRDNPHQQFAPAFGAGTRATISLSNSEASFHLKSYLHSRSPAEAVVASCRSTTAQGPSVEVTRDQRTVRLVVSTASTSVIELNDVVHFNAQNDSLIADLTLCIIPLRRIACYAES